MKTTLAWAALWAAILAGGYWISSRLLAPPPVTHSLASGAHEIVVAADRNGHFYLDGSINGTPLRFMVDTGATYVSVGTAFARRARLPRGAIGYFSTANGSVEGEVVKGQAVRAGPYELTGLSVAVMPAGGEEGLLGQNFLRRFDVSQSGSELRLRPRPASP
ncbi:MAG TPA: retropepsin-like aspartic protease [Burkholderiales bacterium]|nr:retropepsin-like aspartic protease [Burkholderiales bacterium]